MTQSRESLRHGLWTRLAAVLQDGSADDTPASPPVRLHARLKNAVGVDVIAVTPPALLGLLLLLTLRPQGVPDPLGVGDHHAWVVLVGALGLPSLLALRASAAPLTTPLDRWVIALAAIAVVGLPWAADKGTTLFALAALGANLAVYYASVGLVRRDEWTSRVLLAVCIAAIFMTQILAFVYHLGEGLLNRTILYPQPEGWSGYPELGLLAAVLVVLLLASLGSLVGLLTRAAVAWLLAVALLALVFLYSRMSWVAVAAVFAFAVFDAWRAGRRRMLLGVVCAMAIFGGTIVALNPTLQRLTLGIVGLQNLVPPTPDATVYIATPDMRMDLWAKTADMVTDHPLVGVGLGNFQSVFERVYNPELNDDGRRGGHAHNLWLHYAAELGVPGGLVFIGLWSVLLHQAWKRRHDLVGRAAFYVLVAVAVRQVADNLFFSPGGASGRLQTLTWIWAAVAMASPSTRPEARRSRS
jgi:putative inorganic carbon (HCO3(-)) transporter